MNIDKDEFERGIKHLKHKVEKCKEKNCEKCYGCEINWLELEVIENVLKELEKKDKLINKLRENLTKEDLAMSEMAGYIASNTDITFEELNEQCIECRKDMSIEYKSCMNCIKQYFRKKVLKGDNGNNKTSN